MTINDKKNELPNRPNLQRLLCSRQSDKIIYYVLISSTVIYFSILFINTLILSATSKIDLFYDELIVHFIVVTLLALFTQFNIRKKIFTQVHLLSQGMNIEYKNKKLFIPYSEIEKITPPSTIETLRLVSYRIVLKSGKKILIPVFMERTEYIIDVLASVNKDLISEDNILNYRRKIIANDHMMTRLNESLESWKKLVVKYYMIPTGIFLIKYFIELRLSSEPDLGLENLLSRYFWVVSFTSILGAFVTLATEVILYLKTKKQIYDNPNDTRRHLELEASVQKNMSYFYYFVMVLTIWWSLLLTISTHV